MAVLQPLGSNGQKVTATSSSSLRVLPPLGKSGTTQKKPIITPTPVQKTQKVLNTPAPKPKTNTVGKVNGLKLNLTDPQQPASAKMKVTKKSLEQDKKSLDAQTKIIDAVSTKAQQIFPQTTHSFTHLMDNKLDTKKAYEVALDSLKTPLKEEKDRIIKYFEAAKKAKSYKEINGGFLGLGSPEIAGKKLEVISGAANVVFSPITALFAAAEHVPVLATISRAISIPFSLAGESASALSGKAVDVLPIAENDKKSIKQGVQEISALAAQLLLGKASGGKKGEVKIEKVGEIGDITAAQKTKLIEKYGLQDALTIEAKAKELAKTKLKEIKEGETYSPKELRDRVIGSELENTPEGKALIKASFEAEKTGQSVRIGENKAETLTTFEKNIDDYRQSPGKTPGVKTVEDAALRDITKQVENPTVKSYTQERVADAIKNKEIKANSDGTITVYRAGETTGRNRLISATYNRAVAERFAAENNVPIKEFQVKPSDIQAFVGRGEKEVLIKSEIQVQGKTPSKIGKSIEQKAIDEQLTKGFDNVAGYDKITIADQSKRATDLINNDFERARRIVRGEEQLPAELRGTSLITAMEQVIKKTGDKDLAYELANSRLVSATSEAAQNLRLAAERIPDSLTVKLRELKELREKEAMKRTGKKSVDSAVKSEVDKIKTEVRKASPKKQDWSSFIDSIQC